MLLVILTTIRATLTRRINFHHVQLQILGGRGTRSRAARTGAEPACARQTRANSLTHAAQNSIAAHAICAHEPPDSFAARAQITNRAADISTRSSAARRAHASSTARRPSAQTARRASGADFSGFRRRAARARCANADYGPAPIARAQCGHWRADR